MRVLITGSSNGIGLECAKKFLATGHEVFGLDQSSGIGITCHWRCQVARHAC